MILCTEKSLFGVSRRPSCLNHRTPKIVVTIPRLSTNSPATGRFVARTYTCPTSEVPGGRKDLSEIRTNLSYDYFGHLFADSWNGLQQFPGLKQFRMFRVTNRLVYLSTHFEIGDLQFFQALKKFPKHKSLSLIQFSLQCQFQLTHLLSKAAPSKLRNNYRILFTSSELLQHCFAACPQNITSNLPEFDASRFDDLLNTIRYRCARSYQRFAIAGQFSQPSNVGRWYETWLQKANRQKLSQSSAVFHIGLSTPQSFNVLRIHQHYRQRGFQNVEYRLPVNSGAFNGDDLTTFAYQPISQIDQIVSHCREPSYVLLAISKQTRNKKLRMHIDSTAVVVDYFHRCLLRSGRRASRMFKNLLGVLASTRSNSQWFLEEAREQTVQRACASRVAAPLSKRSLIPP